MGKLTYIGASILPDNDMELLDHIMMILNYSDCCYDILINKKVDELIIHITPSDPEFKSDIIENLLWINKVLHQKVIFSKSLKISKIVSFIIETKE